MLADGCLIHKGRKDFRVKIRGYGVEISEVENALRGHAAIREVLVVGRDNDSAETRLVAYFTTATHRIPTTSELREFLSKVLPDYMIPSAFVRLDAIPVTPNGKIYRSALPAPEKARLELGVPYVAPSNEIEQALSQIWAEVLSVDTVGIHDNFFDLGGHSLSASRVISRVIRTFQLELPLKFLFDSPTVAEMATVIAQYQAKAASQETLERMLREIDSMSEAEAEKLLSAQSRRS
jgi:acyl carrier protein